MKTEDKTSVMALGAVVLGVSVGFAAKDWTAGMTLFGALVYAIPLMNRISKD